MKGHDVFISYASRDKALAQAACAALEAGGLTCWIAARDVRPSGNFFDDVFPAIRGARMLAMMLTAHACASKHVLREVVYADDCNLPLLFLRALDGEPPGRLRYFLTTSQWLDATTSPPPEAHLPRLVEAASALLAESIPAKRGQRYGEYEVVLRDDGTPESIGHGTWSKSYRAVPASGVGPAVALKTLTSEALLEPGAHEEFRRRGAAALSLQHPGAARVLAVGMAADNSPFYATEFIEGENLHEEVGCARAMDGEAVWTILAELADTLAAAFAANLLHGDIKPTNLRRNRATGKIMLVDFGLAKGLNAKTDAMAALTESSLPLDNPAFASPERCLEEPLDVRSDLYSLGATVWFLLTGEPLFKGGVAAVIGKQISMPPPLETLRGVPRHIVHILERLLAKNPDDRPANPAALLAEMRASTSGAELSLSLPPVPPLIGEPDPPALVLEDVDSKLFDTMFIGPDASPGSERAVERNSEVSDPPATFDHFEIPYRENGSLWELGRGGLAVTYKAYDTQLQRVVALKVARPFGNDAAGDRFMFEARAASRVRHPHVVSIYAVGQREGQCFCAMELIEGKSVQSRIRDGGPLPVFETLAIAYQTALALEAVEGEHLVHGDIKPGNLMLLDNARDKPFVKVIDFGLARAADEESADSVTTDGFMGTPLYASPEQFTQSRLDIRSDIYSLGITLWHMLTGEPPFKGGVMQVLHQHKNATPPFERLAEAGIPTALMDLLRYMLAKDPADRPRDARELVADHRRLAVDARSKRIVTATGSIRRRIDG